MTYLRSRVVNYLPVRGIYWTTPSMSDDDFDAEQRIQESQYEYPYHYIPTVEDGRFSQLQYWSWGLQYLAGIRLALELLDPVEFDSLLDIGCGDGRFLRECNDRYPGVDLKGVDYSARSIAFAKAMNPTPEFEVRDIVEDPLNDAADAATAIEVLEHIEPEDCQAFVSAIADALPTGGTLVLTVPHENKSLNEKHYQHFTSDKLRNLLEPTFTDLEIIPFDADSKLLSALLLALGGEGTHYVINSPIVTNAIYRLYSRRYLYVDDESNCRRIAVRCRKV